MRTLLFLLVFFLYLTNITYSQKNNIEFKIDFLKDGKLFGLEKNIKLNEKYKLVIEPLIQNQEKLFFGIEVYSDSTFYEQATFYIFPNKKFYFQESNFIGNERIKLELSIDSTFGGIGTKWLVFYAYPTTNVEGTNVFEKELHYYLRQCCNNDSTHISKANVFVSTYKVNIYDEQGPIELSRNNPKINTGIFKIKDSYADSIFKLSLINQSIEYTEFMSVRGNIHQDLVYVLNDLAIEVYKQCFDILFNNNLILKDFGVLFYKFEDNELKIFLFADSGMIAFDNSLINESDLLNLANSYRAKIGVSELETTRAPYKLYNNNKNRGIEAIEYNDKQNLVNEPEKKLIQALFPHKIKDRMFGFEDLIIIPDGCIGTIPLYSLKVKGNRYLIDKMNLVMASSIKDIFNYSNSSWDDRFTNPLVVGNPLFPEKNTEWYFPQLPGAEKEAYNISEFLSATPLIGNLAAKDTVVKLAKNADLLYFATHAIADCESSFENSFLVFSGEPDNYKWTYNEIQNSKLSAKLCVLSACQTGVGYIHNGGIMTLAEAFEKAGIPRVIMSLWSIDDISTQLLMSNFMKYIQLVPPYKALRQAALDLKENAIYKEPKYWSPFMYFGYPY